MKQITLVVIFLLTGFCLFAVGDQEEDEYVGMTLEEVIKKFGPPDSESLKMINKDYIGYESEPDYSKYFSDSQLAQSVIINVISYKKQRQKIILWLKNINNNWVVFSSIKFNPNKVVY